ncbi:TfoX N-terminal domain-containing protein [Devosia lucknowensis]|uniref:TfoX N-terminal domain-containing protein n=1 Tax=Devosia lucknowensis TaxID=1096929 RepID=A0A1Y6EV22_9HYPH|nr:TfoX/Sxy family protein [Devosia lucknowensis]SMQ66397.1 TfoX N-terminal domain-containing protein [Devosia lucknowensis]
MSMASDELAERIRALLPPEENIREQKMFGGIAFMLGGNMLVCPTKEGSLIVRVGKNGVPSALDLPGAEVMEMGGRTVSGFVVVSGDAIEDEFVLGEWLDRARAFVRTLPPK